MCSVILFHKLFVLSQMRHCVCTRRARLSHNPLISYSHSNPTHIIYVSHCFFGRNRRCDSSVLPLVTGALLHALAHSASIVAGDIDGDGEQYAMQITPSVPAVNAPANSVVVISLDTPQEDEVSSILQVCIFSGS